MLQPRIDAISEGLNEIIVIGQQTIIDGVQNGLDLANHVYQQSRLARGARSVAPYTNYAAQAVSEFREGYAVTSENIRASVPFAGVVLNQVDLAMGAGTSLLSGALSTPQILADPAGTLRGVSAFAQEGIDTLATTPMQVLATRAFNTVSNMSATRLNMLAGDVGSAIVPVGGVAARVSNGARLARGTRVVEGGAVKVGIQANKAAGDAIRDVIAAREAPSLIEQSFTTVGGVRRVDVLKLGDKTIAIESKVGRTSLGVSGSGSRVRQELARDWWLRRQGQVSDVRWEFSPSGVTGEVGPTAPLLEKLNKLGFDVRINP